MPPTVAPTTLSPVSKWLPAPCKWHHSLPSQPTALQQTHQPLVLCPELPTGTTMSQPTTAKKRKNRCNNLNNLLPLYPVLPIFCHHLPSSLAHPYVASIPKNTPRFPGMIPCNNF
ncbi:hypothetical protein L208DRAFT_910634 [Tricholoma matsutake]|nr:hypothetical protein L208DRAFT_910634 [Tricholoma matsutake 945]